jgi:GMP synthase PP-ATPase subunit
MRAANRIMSKSSGITHVVYDIADKLSSTIEWE